MKTLHSLSPLALTAWFLFSWLVDVRAETFRDGETVCFLGDSITHGRQYHGLIYSYYLTRFPDREIRFINAGVAGDSAGGAMGRLEEDVLSKSPSVVVVMLGMNDVGRGNYVADPDEAQLAAQAGALERYQANLDQLLARIREASAARFILLTPTPFDQTAENDKDNNQPGCNDGLAKCADFVRQLAKKYEAEVIDFHGPMTDFNRKKQEQDSTFTLIGPDRVHPGLPGNLMMAWLFLEAQGAPALVSEIELDARTGQSKETKNATVSKIERNDSDCDFTVVEKALPWPVDAEARKVLGSLPIEENLNQEILKVAGLEPGTYALRIDGTEVAQETASRWAEGINLALHGDTPQAKQAAEVARINEKRRLTEVTLRNYASVRWFLRHRKIDPDDLDAVRKFSENLDTSGYYESKVPTYLSEWPNHRAVEEEVLALEKEAFQARAPREHRYELLQITE